jgi:PAS fold
LWHGISYATVLHPDDRQVCLKRWREALRTGEPYEIEYRFRRTDGAYRWHLGRALPIRDEQQHIISWSGTDTDIDDQKRAEEQLSIRACQQAAVAEFGQHALKGMDLPDLFDKLLLKVSEVLNIVYVSLSELLDDGTLQVHARNREGITYLTVNEWQASQAAYTLASKEPVIIGDDLRRERRFTVPLISLCQWALPRR